MHTVAWGAFSACKPSSGTSRLNQRVPPAVSPLQPRGLESKLVQQAQKAHS